MRAPTAVIRTPMRGHGPWRSPPGASSGPAGTWRRRTELDGEDRELVVAAITESIRLLMARTGRPLGDLDLYPRWSVAGFR